MVSSHLHDSAIHFLNNIFAISIVDASANIIYVNDKFCTTTQYEPDEIIGKPYTDILHMNDSNSTKKSLLAKFQQNKASQLLLCGETKDSSPYCNQSLIIPITHANHYLLINVDLTNPSEIELKDKFSLIKLYNLEQALHETAIVTITNKEGVIKYVNDKFCQLSQYSEEEILGKTHRLVNSNYHNKEFFTTMWDTVLNGDVWSGEIRNRAKDGSFYWVHTTIVPFLDDSRTPYEFISIRTNITEKKNAEIRLQNSLKNDFNDTVKNLQNAIFKYTYDENSHIVMTLIEGKIVQKLGEPFKKAIENEIKFRFSTGSNDSRMNSFQNSNNDTPITFELPFLSYTFLVYLSPIYHHSVLREVVGTATDITVRKNIEKEIEYMAYNDHLTNLPNRRYFELTVEKLIKNNDTPFAILFLDLDRFKNVNDFMGHSSGDKLLKAVGMRLKSSVTEHDLVARYGGDEYVILISSENTSEIESIANTIIDSLQKPFFINDLEVFITSSIGISIYPKDGHNADHLISHADFAMYEAKKEGKNRYNFFTQELRLTIIEKAVIEMDLRQALDENQFTLYYQPQLSLVTNEIIGVEALIRWNHPTKGLISPNDFIAIAEECGLIIPIGKWVLETACKQLTDWQQMGLSHLTMSVNVSIPPFKQRTFSNEVKEVLIKTGLDAAHLNLEITESMTADMDTCMANLRELHSIGISISIDDFGTGYSSLHYLSKLPITHLKIDKSFLQNFTTNHKAIITTIVDLGRNLNIIVVAEGVETIEHENFLKSLHCEFVQGFRYFKPLPAKELQKILLENPSDPY